MDPRILRNWGVGFGGAAMAGAVTIAVWTGDPQPPAPDTQPVVAAPLPSPTRASEPADEPIAEAASAPEAPSRPGFLVRFSAEHPLARAQALAAQGRAAEARALIAQLAARRRDLRGLCFERFTLGGAEAVFVSCEPLEPAEAARFSQNWTRRFQTMAGIDYAEPNLIADVEQRRP